MACKPLVTLAVLAPLFAIASPALAQAAAETAVILSGTGQGTGEASRSVGAAAAGGIGRASDAIAATNARARARGGSARRGGSGQGGFVITGGNADALEGTDAPLVQTGSGASIRVSGRLIPAAVPAPAKPPAPAAPELPPKP